MNFTRIYGLFLRHFYLITRSFPRILDLIYWPSIQITLWGFISNFFAEYSTYYSGAVGVILSCAILYDFLFRTSIGFNMLFLEEIWSRNFTNLFIAPMKVSEIIISLVFTALIRALIGLVPAILLTSPLFGISLLELGMPLAFLFLRHFYLITRSFPRILDLIYWPSIQITLWGFISNFFAEYSTYYSGAVGVILSCAILYDFLFRTSIGFNMLFLEEIWSRNFTNLFIAPMKISEIIISLVFTALIRALIGLVPAILLTSPLFGISLLELGMPLAFLFLSLYIFGITLGLLVSAGLLRFGPSFENIAWSTMFLLAPFGCIYYPVEILPGIFQSIAFALPLVYIFEETRNILVNGQVSYENIYNALYLNIFYLILSISIFYYSFDKARDKGTLINIGE
jgi:ABC-2 type transport system permease protein